MSSRKDLKQRRRREREEAERRAHEQARRRLRLHLYAALAAAAAALAVGAVVVALDGGDDPKEAFSAKHEGLAERLQAEGQDRFREVRDLDGLRLEEGDEVYVTYGTHEQSPIVL